MLIITVQIFPCVSKFFPVSEQNFLCFPCLEKVRTKFPVFPVPWPPCTSSNYLPHHCYPHSRYLHHTSMTLVHTDRCDN